MQQPNGISSGLSVMMPHSDLLSPDQSIEQMVDRTLSTGFPSSVGQSLSSIRPPSSDLSVSSMAGPSPFRDTESIFPTLFDDSFSASLLRFQGHDDQGHDMLRSSKPSTEGRSPLHPSLTIAKHTPSRVPLGDITGRNVISRHDKPVNDHIDPPVNDHIDKPINKPINKSLDQSLNQPLDHPLDKHNRPHLSYIEQPSKKPRVTKKPKQYYYSASRNFAKDKSLNLQQQVNEARDKLENQGKFGAAIRVKILHDEWDALDEESRESYKDQVKKKAEVPVPTKYLFL
jgi:hypothetical protein